MINDITIPSTGAIIMNATIFRTPDITTDPIPALAIAAPTKPPTRVWEELDGRPHHQVNRFQMMALIKADPMTVRLITSGLTTPLPMVVATFKLKIKKAMKLKKAAKTTAVNGARTFVETTVAIEFAES